MTSKIPNVACNIYQGSTSDKIRIE